MVIDEKFNKRAAKLIDVNRFIRVPRSDAKGIMIEFSAVHNSHPEMLGSGLKLHMTPDEALQMAHDLIEAVIYHKSKN